MCVQRPYRSLLRHEASHWGVDMSSGEMEQLRDLSFLPRLSTCLKIGFESPGVDSTLWSSSTRPLVRVPGYCVGRLSFYPVPNIDMGRLGQGSQGLVPWLRRADFSAVVAAHVSAGMDWFVSAAYLNGVSWLFAPLVVPEYAVARRNTIHSFSLPRWGPRWANLVPVC